MSYLKTILRWGFVALGSLLAACFVYGLFNRFEFWHGAARPGIDSGLAYVWFGGLIAGPLVFLASGVVGAARLWWRKRKQKF